MGYSERFPLQRHRRSGVRVKEAEPDWMISGEISDYNERYRVEFRRSSGGWRADETYDSAALAEAHAESFRGDPEVRAARIVRVRVLHYEEVLQIGAWWREEVDHG